MRRAAFIAAALLSLPGCGDPPVPAPAAAVLSMQDSEGHTCTPLAAGQEKATVLLFLMHDCPVANAMAPEIARIAREFTPQGVRFYGVYATETAAEINTHRADYSLPFPGLPDGKGTLARHAGATRVPEAAVFSAAGALLYRGRIDDRAVQPGITRPEPQRRDLREALASVLAGRNPDPKFTTVTGCYLPAP